MKNLIASPFASWNIGCICLRLVRLKTGIVRREFTMVQMTKSSSATSPEFKVEGKIVRVTKEMGLGLWFKHVL